MKKQDKILAIGGIVIIILLAIIAIALLFRPTGYVSLVEKEERVEVKEEERVVASVTEEKDESLDVVTKDDKSEAVETSTDKAIPATAKGELSEYYIKSECKKVKNDDSQLKELYYYWDEYQLEAVDDLIRLPRIRAFTLELAGTNEYYYYGDVDENMIPNGKGLAIYADDTYYFGEWKNGLREGEGMWMRIYLKSSKEGTQTGIIEHQYSGEFKNDLPNGKGQEHCDVVDEDITNDLTIVNVIGDFVDGYYGNDLYIMTQNIAGNRYDWYADANKGVFNYREPNKISTTNKRPVWSKGEENNHDTDDSDNGYHWMSDEENKNFGIYGLKKQP